MRLASIDLNLLVALDVLLHERHVTRAARRLGVTQSAMSQTLQRLRALFDDPLLVRRGSAMAATPFADRLAVSLAAALRQLEGTVSARARFDPALTERTFRIALFDIYASNLVPRLVARLRAAAPSAVLRVEALSMRDIIEQHRDGRVDVGLLVPRAMPGDIVTEPLIEETMVSMVRERHPILRKRRTIQEMIRWPHVTFQITGEGPTAIDHVLAEHGATRHVPVQVAAFLSAPALVCSSDLIATVPRTAALSFRERWPLELFRAPFGDMEYVVHMTWSRHLDADEGQRWFRSQVREAAAALLE